MAADRLRKKAASEIVDGRSQSPQKVPAQNTVSPFPSPTKKKMRTELSRLVIPLAEAELKRKIAIQKEKVAQEAVHLSSMVRQLEVMSRI